MHPLAKLFEWLFPGGVALLDARPGQCKTLMGLELAIKAKKAVHRGAFFTLEYT